MGVDMSDCRLLKARFSLSKEFIQNLQKLKCAMRIGYACLDVILDEKGHPWVIDFNPLGSFPPFNKHPEVIRQLAAELLN